MSENRPHQRADQPQGAGEGIEHPGRTQEINYFTLGDDRYLVDLPGYGFANAPVPVVEKWQRLMRQYLSGRPTLRRAFVLVDARHGIKSVDQDILGLLDRAAVTFQCVLTKTDKVKQPDRDTMLDGLRTALARHGPLSGTGHDLVGKGLRHRHPTVDHRGPGVTRPCPRRGCRN